MEKKLYKLWNKIKSLVVFVVTNKFTVKMLTEYRITTQTTLHICSNVFIEGVDTSHE